MQIRISDHFSYGKLLRFTLPAIATMVFLSIYTIVDGIFVSNFVGVQAFAAVNLIWPLIAILGVLGLIVGSGGSAVVARTMGEGRPAEANRIFSQLVLLGCVAGLALGVAGFGLVPAVVALMGADGTLAQLAVTYGRILCAGIPLVFMQDAFQVFFITAERPKLGFLCIFLAGITNIALDWLFIAVMGWGVVGAAWATVLGELVGGAVPLVYFLLPNSTTLRIGRPGAPDWAAIRQTCINGSSEAVTNISSSLVSMLYNYQLMLHLGQDGVAAYGVIMYVSFIFMGIFVGQTDGTSPIISYHYGAHDRREVSNLFRKNSVVMVVMGVVLTLAAALLAGPLAAIFVGDSPEVMALTTQGLTVFKWAFLVMGLNVFASGFFTALGNGPVSAAISFLRTMVFEAGCIMLLPGLVGAQGIWASMVVAEVLSLAVSMAFVLKLRPRYGYSLRKPTGRPTVA